MLDVVHSDLSGRISPPSLNGGRYYLKLTDGFSKYKHIYILKHKSEALPMFKVFKSLVENQTGSKIKRLVNDGGGEYVNSEFKTFLESEGILMDITAAYTPQQNAISERGNRTTTERARCLLIEANLPKSFWAEAVNTSIYIENRCPEASINHLSPHELWHGSKPKIDHLRVFGCAAYRLIPKQFRGSKFSPTSQRCVLLGYQERMYNYRLFDLGSKRIIFSHDVIFDEADFSSNSSLFSSPSSRDLLLEELDFVSPISHPTVTTNLPDFTDLDISPADRDPVVPVVEISHVVETADLPLAPLSSDPTVVPDSSIVVSDPPPSNSPFSPSSPPPVSLGKRKAFVPQEPSTPIARFDISSQIDSRNIIDRCTRRANAASVPDPPRTFKQAMNSPTRTQWLEAVEVELDKMKRRGVWTIVDLPSGCRAVGTVWVFKTKVKPDGEFLKHKARLCA